MEPNRTSSNPFFRTQNGGYGVNWQASSGVNPLQMQETPEYRDLVRLMRKVIRIFRVREN